jgi:hypothetical protein
LEIVMYLASERYPLGMGYWIERGTLLYLVSLPAQPSIGWYKK